MQTIAEQRLLYLHDVGTCMPVLLKTLAFDTQSDTLAHTHRQRERDPIKEKNLFVVKVEHIVTITTSSFKHHRTIY